MITTRTRAMSITQMLRSPVAVFLTIASCVAGAPVQIEGENIGLGQAVYSQPELAEALARTYEALEWQERIRENEEEARNLDHIGGGNLLRNLDHIGGGNLLRDLDIKTIEQSRSDQNAPSKADKFNHGQMPRPFQLKDDPSTWPEGCGTLDAIGGPNIICRVIVDANEFERNLDHIGGGNLLRDVDFRTSARSRLAKKKPSTNNQVKNGEQTDTVGSKDAPSRQSTNLCGNLDRCDTVSLNELERNLDHIGGGNLLRDLDFQTFVISRLATSEPLIDEQINQSSPTLMADSAGRFRNDPSQRSINGRTVDSVGSGYLIGPSAVAKNKYARTLDRIGGGNLLRDLERTKTGRSEQSTEERVKSDGPNPKSKLANGFLESSPRWVAQHRNLDHIGGGNLLRHVIDEEYGLQRNLDHIGGEPEARNLDSIGGGHLMRQSRRGLDSLSGATFGESKRFDPRRKQNEPTKQNSNWPNVMNRMQFDSSAKRNFDEIDRTNFDSFVKRNFDEIDRTGWNSFVKRRFMDAYLASRQR